MNHYTVLIADDEPSILIHTAETIEQFGFATEKVKNGLEVLVAVTNNIPDIIVLDWNMPEMDGLETLLRLKSNPTTTNIPVIMLTGFMTNPESLKTALEAGAIDFVKKPFEKTELMARINSVIENSETHHKQLTEKDLELITLALSLAQSSESNLSIISKLEAIRKMAKDESLELKSAISTLIDEINDSNTCNNWNKFNIKFTLIYPLYVKSILKIHPNLTPAEIKLCTLLRLDINSKNIAAITNLAYDSVRVSRTRLRKKLGLENEDGLVAYLMGF